MHLECLHVNIRYKVNHPHSSRHKLENIKKWGGEIMKTFLQN